MTRSQQIQVQRLVDTVRQMFGVRAKIRVKQAPPPRGYRGLLRVCSRFECELQVAERLLDDHTELVSIIVHEVLHAHRSAVTELLGRWERQGTISAEQYAELDRLEELEVCAAEKPLAKLLLSAREQ
jgi:hypothetical protein